MKPALFLLAAVALLASFLEADRQKHPQLMINAVSAQAAAPPAKIRADPVARLKFPKVSAGMIDALSYVNRLVNANMRGVSDQEQYGRPEMWVMFPPSGAGDCEDYVLTKLGLLSDAGFPVLLMRVRGVIAKGSAGQDGGHALLELLLPDGSIAFMDNLQPDLMTRPELEAQGYVFYDW